MSVELRNAAFDASLLEEGNRIRLSRGIFDRGALVFKHPGSTSFRLWNDLNSHSA